MVYLEELHADMHTEDRDKPTVEELSVMKSICLLDDVDTIPSSASTIVCMYAWVYACLLRIVHTCVCVCKHACVWVGVSVHVSVILPVYCKLHQVSVGSQKFLCNWLSDKTLPVIQVTSCRFQTTRTVKLAHIVRTVVTVI